ncbi:hypothetical protein PL321_09315 [Caloramator sp. mosi_1]|uniref:hypothetical protein n=1 Tax=Caloramator sp. mosi_1 TaxID=3023090 RepID=UPI002361939F|nr:hypothetical protein [Caloramator sp. mosi_1]WDC85476.1 hypothetical protein PL321_09315 [Caloramator sp. mosi_1]
MHFKNNTYQENLKLKCNFTLIEKSISEFIKYYTDRELNSISIEDNGEVKIVYSDIIIVRN